jgi:hypothetical protein
MKWDAYLIVSAKNKRKAFEKSEEITDLIAELRKDIGFYIHNPKNEDKLSQDRFKHDKAIAEIGKPKGIEMKKKALELNKEFNDEHGYPSGFFFYDQFGETIVDKERIQWLKEHARDDVAGEKLFICYGRIYTR